MHTSAMADSFRKFSSALQIASHVTVMLCGVALITTFVIDATSSRYSEGLGNELAIGNKIQINDVDFSRTSRTLVVAIQEGCHYCSESLPFYKAVTSRLQGRKDIRTLVVMPNDLGESKAYLARAQVIATEVRQLPLPNIKVSGTPTLLLVDRKGIIRSLWIGKLSSHGEQEVIKALS